MRPKPRALLIGFDDEMAKELNASDLLPTIHYIDDTSELGHLSQAEYEVIICYEQGDLRGLEYESYVVALGGDNLGWADLGSRVGALHASFESVDTVFKVPEELDQSLRDLIESGLIPLFQSEKEHKTLGSISRESRRSNYGNVAYLWHTLVADNHERPLAGHTVRSQADHELWYIHSGISMKQLHSWLSYLIKRWASKDHEAFPYSVDWRSQPEWQTAGELLIAGKINDNETSFAAAQAKYNTNKTTLDKELTEAKEAANNGYRKLLHTQGDDLKEAVSNVLGEIGFTVVDVDEVREATAPGSEKLEDLRISLAVKGGNWTALSEVRGYSKGGAKTADLIRITGRFSKRYIAETGTEPDALWYIVNHDFDKVAPPDRKLALTEQPKDIKTFSEDGGLVIDTVELFRLYSRIEKGEVTPEQARNTLMSSVGTFRANDVR